MNRRLIFLLLLFGAWGALGAPRQFDDLLESGKSYLRQGQYLLALELFETAGHEAVSPEQRSAASGFRGMTRYKMNQLEAAEGLLRGSIAESRGRTPDTARFLAVLAEVREELGQSEDARYLFAEARKLAGEDQTLLAGIQLGEIKRLPDPAERLLKLRAIHDGLGSNTTPDDRARLLVNIGTQARRLGAPGRQLAYAALNQAGRDFGQGPRLRAEALDELAQLYEDQQRLEEALQLSQQASRHTEFHADHDLLLGLEWRQGRIHRRFRRNPEAIAAYQRAVEHIQAIRQEIPIHFHEGRSSFRDTLEPVYLDLADLLLDQASGQSGAAKDRLLRNARETVERVKRSELEDFLGGHCALENATHASVETIEAGTAVLYPIILSERLELLVSIGSELRQFTQKVEGIAVQSAARQFASSLRRNSADSGAVARALHQWLIAPAEPWLRERGVRTLVVVPDGPLRLIPFGALHDGRRYVIEDYAVATSPGLALLQPRTVPHRSNHALLAGMSEPGPVVDHLPGEFLKDMANALDRGIKLVPRPHIPNTRALPISMPTADLGPVSRAGHPQGAGFDAAFLRGLKQDLRLPGVIEEIDGLRGQIPNDVLMNQDFTKERFAKQLAGHDYSVVHLASHGVFGQSASSSFIMAYDAVIGINELDGLLRTENPRKEPIALLSLSACQTAEGDDRAPLGFSGVALKARVGSALGTLWPVSDDAAAKLMPEFYGNLARPGISKAESLRLAQLSLLKDPRFAHPFFWAPFLLVGNWL